jgi:C1A family cysteine protease
MTDVAAPEITLPDAEGRRFGWRPPTAQQATHFANRFAFQLAEPLFLPASADLRGDCPPVYDQGGFSACTANAVAAMIHYFRIKDGLADLGIPSRMFIYWFERLSTGDEGSDAGGSIGSAMAVASAQGYCSEAQWPYDQANLLVAPGEAATGAAAHHRIGAPVPLSSLGQIKSALSQGQPVAFGLSLYNSFYEADLNQGIVPMPDTTQVCVKHAGLFVGYNDAIQRLIMRNSWGLQTSTGRPCGDQGYYYLPYAYIAPNLSTDYWTLGSIQDLP